MPESPFKNRSGDRVQLSVEAADNATEIFLVNSQFQRIDKGVGRLDADVTPGLYKIRFRSGQQQVDQLIEVDASETAKTVNGPAVEIATAAPIGRTLASCETHQKAARELSRSVKLKRGNGSWLFLFARDLVPSATGDPWQGVSLHSVEGHFWVDFSKGDCDTQNTFCGLSVAVDPGVYRLRVQVDAHEVYEMFVVAVEGWQTQVFILVDSFSPLGNNVRHASLPTTSLFMAAAGQGFDPLSEVVRQVELVRQGLVSGRDVLMRSALKKNIAEQSLNPMLGIFGAHLLMGQRCPDYELIADIISQLGEPFKAHPDIRALRLHPKLSNDKLSDSKLSDSKLSSPETIDRTSASSPFSTPPMLRSSWQHIVRASRQQINLVPAGSLADRVADGLLYTAPWLIHRLTEPASAPLPEISLAEVNQEVQSLLALPLEQKAQLRAELEALKRTKQFTALEQNLLNATVFRPEIPFLEDVANETETLDRFSDRFSEMPSLEHLLSAIDAPTGAIARSIHSILYKLQPE